MHRKKCKGRITSDYLAGRGQVCERGSAPTLAFKGHPLQARTKKTKPAAVVFQPSAIAGEPTHGRAFPSRRPLQKSTYVVVWHQPSRNSGRRRFWCGFHFSGQRRTQRSPEQTHRPNRFRTNRDLRNDRLLTLYVPPGDIN